MGKFVGRLSYAVLIASWFLFLLDCQATSCSNVVNFKRNDRMILNEILIEDLRYPNIEGFFNDTRVLDYQFNAMPNYFRSGRESHLHYRLIVHYRSFSVTLIYDSIEKEVVERQMFSNW